MKIIGKMASFAIVLVVAIGLAFIPGTASALSIVNLTVSNEELGVDGIYGTVTWDVTTEGENVDFIVDANESLLNGLNQNNDPVTNWGIDKFYFNTTPDLDPDVFTFILPEGWDVDVTKNADGFGEFMIETAGTPRYDPLEFSVSGFTGAVDADFFILSADPAGNGHGHFAMHVGGFTPMLNGEGSAFFRDGVSVPDASIMWLLGPAFIALGFFSRKKFKQTSNHRLSV